MIRRDPSLRLLRLVVTKSGKSAYDETFHPGVNMIRSEGNSRGKSTIADLIFFSLGGDLTEWKAEAGTCDQTFAEVALNGSVLTLRRDISITAKQLPMWIYFGAFTEAANSAVEGWIKLTYSRYGDRESFSQVLFRAMGIPEVPSEDANITMHQLLRLMYVDQMTPVNAIFRMEERDSPYRRQAVGDLLCGVLDERIYPSQIRARQLDREYSDVASQFTGLMRVLRRVDETVDFSDLLSRLNETEAARRKALEEIEALRESRYSADHDQSEASSALEVIRRDLDKVSRDIVALQRDVDRLTLSIEDAALLISDLEKNLFQIGQSQATGEVLGPLVFSFCPSCFSPIEGPSEAHHCHLCKGKLGEVHDLSRYARLRNELEMQLKESRELQKGRKTDLAALEERLGGLQRVRSLLSEELLGRSRHYLTEADARIDALTKSVGYLERELIDIDRERRLATEVTELAARKEQLNSELSELRSNIAAWIAAKERRQSSIYGLVSRITADILRGDIPSDIEEVAQDGVRFDFGDNEVVVNEKRGYSASSRTVIKNAFHLALLLASCRDDRMKYPRFLLLDNIEDKGMTPQRSHNSQRLILEFSDKAGAEHQIIFTTSMPAPDLDIPKYTVGSKYTETNMSLKLAATS
jgi:predicted  nucleic acid-binding Zn-ribbon protein